MLAKYLITTAALAVATATSTSPALARTDTLRTHTAGPPIKWTSDQLQALGDAYRAKNPGWCAPASSDVHVPADLTWTSENLDRLANAYAALNPGWTRPAGPVPGA